MNHRPPSDTRVISLKPKLKPIEQRPLPALRYVDNMHTPKSPPIHFHKPIETRLLSPPVHPSKAVTLVNKTIMRPGSHREAEIYHSPRHSIEPQMEPRSPKIPTLNIPQQYTPKPVDSILIQKSHSPSHSQNNKDARHLFTFNSKDYQEAVSASRKTEPPSSPPTPITHSKHSQIPIRYQNYIPRKSQKPEDSNYNLSEIRSPETPKKGDFSQLQTTISSHNKLHLLTQKLQQLVNYNESLQMKSEDLKKTFIERDNDNKKLRKKMGDLNEKTRENRREIYRLEDALLENRMRVHQQMDFVKMEYGERVVGLEQELSDCVRRVKSLEESVQVLEREEEMKSGEMEEFRQLFSSMKTGLSHIAHG